MSPQHIQIGVREDDELNKLLAFTHITGGGTNNPHVHAKLFPGKKVGNKFEEPT